jgi:hypothetical protein
MSAMHIRQIVFAAADLAGTRAVLADVLALDPPFRDPGVSHFGLDNAVFVLGTQFAEIVAPVQAATTAGRLIERRGDCGYMLILQTDDFAEAAARVKDLRVRTVWQGAHDDIEAMHLHPKDIGGAIVSVDQPKPPESWRWGGPDWRVQPGARGHQRVTGVTVEAVDPAAMAARWGAVLGLPCHGTRVTLDGAVVDFVPAGARGEGIAGYALAVTDPDGVRERAAAHGLTLTLDGFVFAGTEIGLSAL